MTDAGVGKRRIDGVARGIIPGRADRDDPRHALRHLVERDAVYMRMEPERAGWMIGRDIDTIIDGIHYDRPVLVRRLRHRDAVGRVEDRDEDEVAEGRIAERCRP